MQQKKSPMNTYTVLLRNGTIGHVVSANAPFIGYEMTVTLRDENGNHIPVTGIVEKILEEKASWQ